MNCEYPITVFFDASCPLCNEEMSRLKEHDTHGNIQLVDCSAPEFVPPVGAPDVATMMRTLHAITAQGQWVVGVPVFQMIYSAVGFVSVAKWLGRPWVSRLTAKVYPVVARYRNYIPRELVGIWFKWLAIRSARRSQRCADGICKL